MCKKTCCPPAGNSGTVQVIALVAAAYIAASVFSAVLHFLETLIEITLITITASTVIGLTTWALVRHHRRQAPALARTAIPARHTPAIPPRYILSTTNQPATALPVPARPTGALTGQHERAIRHFAAVITSYDDPAAVEALIHRALRGPNPNP
jgi:hypothetical protein